MCDGLVAVWAGGAGAESSAESVAVGAAAGVEVALLTDGAFVDDDGSGLFRWPRGFWSSVSVVGLFACRAAVSASS